ncbi:DUF721 domain-containing protein [Acetobacter oryzoeni]|uniref:DUF721 domain-containing protein n=1 Tax=Acetobacter oryzoeni TaxID=2500548 RepID=A0A5B9GNY7_9PROT|nr:DciA family protein [Acetobacter oryzoeni]MCP1203030.1 DciA family protein [Acetobacter oryzoeni]QEE86416.1 DUF721 domain-containing protein [Acetobacter oryzoeni]
MKKEANGGKAVTTPKSRSTRRSPQKTEAAPPPRARNLRSLAALLPAVTAPAFRRRSPTGALLMSQWPDVVGPAHAAVTSPRRLSAGTLTIACAGPVAMELQHLGDTLIARINTWCGEPLVSRLRFVQDPAAGMRPRPQRKKPQKTGVICTLPEMEEGPLRQALETLGTDILKSQNKKRS